MAVFSLMAAWSSSGVRASTSLPPAARMALSNALRPPSGVGVALGRGNARTAFSGYVPDGDLARYANALAGLLQADFAGAMKLLRDKAFQDLLVNYERKPRVFLVAHTVQDTVTSAWLVRGNDGKEYKPDDYLTAFSAFVKEHQIDIAAIGILLKRPQEWNPTALQELRDKLAAAPARFTVENLQRAHEATHKKALVDIISMVKHAANQQQPLLSASERVEQAFVTLTKGRAFSQDNALVEGKNGAVVRKLIGYGYIAGEHAEAIGTFYARHLNPYLNLHRPCGFATVSLDERGKRRRQYKIEDYRTPLEKLKSLERVEQYLKPGVSLAELEREALTMSDTEYARKMGAAKLRLLRRCKVQSPLPPSFR